VSEGSSKTAYEGLWKGKTAWYISKGFTKKQLKEMPNKFRLIVRENKYHKNNDDGTPRFIFSFVDAETANDLRFGRNSAEWQHFETLEFPTIYDHYACSNCGGEPWHGGNIHEYKFCPYCGARMEDD